MFDTEFEKSRKNVLLLGVIINIAILSGVSLESSRILGLSISIDSPKYINYGIALIYIWVFYRFLTLHHECIGVMHVEAVNGTFKSDTFREAFCKSAAHFNTQKNKHARVLYNEKAIQNIRTCLNSNLLENHDDKQTIGPIDLDFIYEHNCGDSEDKEIDSDIVFVKFDKNISWEGVTNYQKFSRQYDIGAFYIPIIWGGLTILHMLFIPFN